MEIAVRSRDLSSAYRFLEIAQVCRDAGRPDEALDWAVRWVRASPERTDHRLREFIADEYLHRARGDDAMAIIWAQFLEQPALAAFQLLKRYADQIGTWALWRSRALAQVRRSIDAAKVAGPKLAPIGQARYRWDLPPDGSRLVDILLWEGHVDEAWSEAKAQGCAPGLLLRLAAEREGAHPEDAIPIYRQEVERLLRVSDKRNYAQAVDLPGRIGPLMSRLGRATEFASCVAGIRAANARRPASTSLLDDAQLVPQRPILRAVDRKSALRHSGDLLARRPTESIWRSARGGLPGSVMATDGWLPERSAKGVFEPARRQRAQPWRTDPLQPMSDLLAVEVRRELKLGNPALPRAMRRRHVAKVEERLRRTRHLDPVLFHPSAEQVRWQVMDYEGRHGGPDLFRTIERGDRDIPRELVDHLMEVECRRERDVRGVRSRDFLGESSRVDWLAPEDPQSVPHPLSETVRREIAEETARRTGGDPKRGGGLAGRQCRTESGEGGVGGQRHRSRSRWPATVVTISSHTSGRLKISTNSSSR
jgi:hypothetical protein